MHRYLLVSVTKHKSKSTKNKGKTHSTTAVGALMIESGEDMLESDLRHNRREGELWNNISGSVECCDLLINNEVQLVPMFIDYISLRNVDNEVPDDWHSKQCATRAAKRCEFIGQFAGSIDVTVNDVSRKSMISLIAANDVGEEFGNDYGEFSTPIGQIPLSRLLDFQPSLFEGGQGALSSLLTLQNPASSPWKLPFVYIISNHRYSEAGRRLNIRFYVYYTRLLFEMIADDEIHILTACLDRKLIEVIPTKTRASQPILFTSIVDDDYDEYDDGSQTLRQSLEYRFSLAGVMEHVVNRGYMVSVHQPEALAVTLYDFQRSTYQWMIDQEKDLDGINAMFWEEWKYRNHVSVFYFPLAGEFRLLRPPKTNGGLLCEEMGLGKTVEIIALILGNPAIKEPSDSTTFGLLEPCFDTMPTTTTTTTTTTISTTSAGDTTSIEESTCAALTVDNTTVNTDNGLPRCRGTLLVVPQTLLGQWFDEFRSKVKDQIYATTSFTVALLEGYRTNTLTQVQCCQIRRPSLDMTSKPSEWGVDFDGSPIQPTKGDIVDVKLPFTLGNVSLRGAVKGSNFLNSSENNEFVVSIKLYNFIEELSRLDVVIISYDWLRTNLSEYRKFHWHRIVLDECQQIKDSTSSISRACAVLSCTNRWIVSGTPLCDSIEDLHGEMNFLKIWPFSLSDAQDGFWHAKISAPFANKSENGLQLLHVLMESVMMRHSKTQRCIKTNQRLVPLPQRSIEWKGFVIDRNNADKYGHFLIKYMECFAAEAFCHYSVARTSTSKRDNSTSRSHIQYNHLCEFVSWISMAISHVSTIPLPKVDFFQRVMASMLVPQPNVLSHRGWWRRVFKFMSAQQTLYYLQSQAPGCSQQEFICDRQRMVANIRYAQMEIALREEYESLTVRRLRDIVCENNLPIPANWQPLPIVLDMTSGSTLAVCHRKKDKTQCFWKKQAMDSPRLSSVVCVGDVLKSTSLCDGQYLLVERVIDATDETVASVLAGSSEVRSDLYDVESASCSYIGKLELRECWMHDSIAGTEVVKKVESFRKQPYVELLVSKKMQEKTKESLHRCNTTATGERDRSCSPSGETFYEEGFSTLFKLMAGQDTDCPICMVPLHQPTFTPCVHAFCRPCIAAVVRRNPTNAKCPVCRTEFYLTQLVEVDTTLIEDNSEKPADGHQEPELITPMGPTSVSASTDTGTVHNDDGNQPGNGQEITIATSTTACSAQRKKRFDDTTVLIIPEFDHRFSAPSTATMQELQKRLISYLPYDINSYRSTVFPSLTPAFFFAYRVCVANHSNNNYVVAADKTDGNTETMHLSPRFKAVLQDMREVLKKDPLAKLVLCSQFPSTLLVFQEMFAELNASKNNNTTWQLPKKVSCALVMGHHYSQNIDAEVARFRHDPECNVCLFSTGVMSVGLTLTMAYTCYILEPAFNAVDESQALNRLYRMGQSHHCVRCVIFYGIHTVEERLLAFRKDNGTIAAHFSEVDDEAATNVAQESLLYEPFQSKKRQRGDSDAESGSTDQSSDIRIIASSPFRSFEQMQRLLGVTNDRIHALQHQMK